jgi:hypothetical protein
MWFGSRDLLVVSTILPQALIQGGAGVESYSDASSGMATIMRNEVLNEPNFLFIYLSPYDLLRNFFSKNEPMCCYPLMCIQEGSDMGGRIRGLGTSESWFSVGGSH